MSSADKRIANETFDRPHDLFHFRQRARHAHDSSVRKFFKEMRRVLLHMPPETRLFDMFQNNDVGGREFAPAALDHGCIAAHLHCEQMSFVAELPGRPTVVMISHDPALTGRADVVARLRDGRVAALERPLTTA